MKKMLAVVLLLVFLVPLATHSVFAEETAQTAVVNAGNALCPVSGDPVSGSDFVVYQGKSYGLCCAACEKIFLNDPAKYVARARAEETTALKAAGPEDAYASKEMESDMEQGSL